MGIRLHDRDDSRVNDEGYSDPTAFEALRNLEPPTPEEDERFHKLLRTIFYLVGLAGFELEGRIVLIDKRTGRTWR